MVLTMQEKLELLQYHEKRFASIIAAKVIDKPVLALWMILIPVFFVFYFWQLKRYARGLREFSEHFLVTRKRALEAASKAVAQRCETDIESVVSQASELSSHHLTAYRVWVKTLSSHYQGLLQSEGESIEELIRHHYRKKANYLLAMNHLDSVERTFHKVLFPAHEAADDEIQSIISSMEKAVARQRKLEAETFFS